ncbi:hypothetical protein ACFV4G_37355 [Kitasatospora sp. NPDC059747]|uniref:hypothetical protein n=1 Tax=Kitasatospora sp. NPDC059747 TaxID=3346930 RepID=UPI00365CEF25
MEISSSPTTTTAEYDRLIARHHAMLLRRQLLTPSAPFEPNAEAYGYDGAADQRLIRLGPPRGALPPAGGGRDLLPAAGGGHRWSGYR